MKFRHLNHFEFFILVKLTHFWPALAFYTPRKRHKTFNFLVFSRDVCPSSLRDGGILIGGKGFRGFYYQQGARPNGGNEDGNH